MSPAPPPPSLGLSPGPIAPGSRVAWQTSHHTLRHGLCPARPELALASTAKGTAAGSTTSAMTAADRQIFVVRWDGVPAYLVPLYSRTYTIFQSLQQIAAQTSSGVGSNTSTPTAEQVSFYARICSLYVDTLRQELLAGPATSADDDDGDNEAEAEVEPTASSSSPSTSGFLPSAIGTWSAALDTLALVGVLYAPADGRGEGVVGEELLHWLNTADCGPTTEEGEQLLDGPHSAEPWKVDGFWSYLQRSLLRGFLASAAQLILTLGGHPSRAVRELAPRLAGHLGAYPRSSQSDRFATERAFLTAHAQWRAGLRLITRPLQTAGWARTAAAAGEQEVDEAEATEVEESVGALLALLAGDEDRVLEESVDWREALAGWALWVRPSLKRDDLPETVERVLERLPLLALEADDDDEAEEEEEGDRQARRDERQIERLQLALVRGDALGAATLAVDAPAWLGAHLVDLLHHLGLVPASSASASTARSSSSNAGPGPIGLRDHYVLAYAGHLGADPALWQIAAEYAGTVPGPVGAQTVGALLAAVGLDREPAAVVEGQAEGGKQEDEPALDEAKVEEILRLLYAHGLEDRARALARTAAGRLAAERRFGLAIAFAVRAGDIGRLDDVADRILASYVQRGPEEFIAHVESIPTSLLDPLSPLSAGSSALAFLPRYRAFLAAYAAGDRPTAAAVLGRAVAEGLAPRSFWAVIMVDLVPLLDDADMLIPTETAFILLGQLEDLLVNSTDDPKAYLGHLANLRQAATDDAAEEGGADESWRWRDVRKSLDVVRLALARYLARDLTLS